VRIDITLVNDDFDISDKKRFDRPPTVEEKTNCGKMENIENTLI